MEFELVKRAQIFLLAKNRKYVRFFLEYRLNKKYNRDIPKQSNFLRRKYFERS